MTPTKRVPYVCDGIGFAETMLGLDGFRVLDVTDSGGEVEVRIETTATVAGCQVCGVRAAAQERRTVVCRDVECFGRPVRLIWPKRRWRCTEPDCDVKTWTETHPGFSSRVLLTRRAGVSATVAVGRDAVAVSLVARRFRVGRNTVHSAVEEFGTALVEDPNRVGTVEQLGMDETSFRAARPARRTEYVTAMVDLQRRVVADVVEGRKGADLRRWLKSKGQDWLSKIKVVATDLTGSYRSGMAGLLDHAVKVVDGFHVVQAANRVVTAVRCRVQNELFGHRGRKGDPLYRTRKLLLTGDNKLTDKGRARLAKGLRLGDPNDEVLDAWLAKEIVRDVYLTDHIKLAKVLLGRAIKACVSDPVTEVRKLGKILTKWRTEILNHHRTGASNGPAEGLNLCIKKVKRAGHGFGNFANYRLRISLHAGGADCTQLTSPITPIRKHKTPLK